MLRIRIEISNPSEDIMKEGRNKIIIKVNKEAIRSWEGWRKEISRYYSKYNCKIGKIMDKDSFVFIPDEGRGNDGIWDIIESNEVWMVMLEYNKPNKRKNSIVFSDSSSSSSESKSYLNVKNPKTKTWNCTNQKPKVNSPKRILNKKRKVIHFDQGSDDDNYSSDSEKKNKNNSKISLWNNVQKEASVSVAKVKKDTNTKRKNENKTGTINNKSTDIDSNIFEYKKENFHLIPVDKYDDIPFLEKNFPQWFEANTLIRFRIQEWNENGIGIGNERLGKVVKYYKDNARFLIDLFEQRNQCNQNQNNSLSSMYDIEGNVLCVETKNFISISIYSTSINNTFEAGENNDVNSTEIIAWPFIKRQLSYYFSDKYYQDSYLHSQADDWGCKHN